MTGPEHYTKAEEILSGLDMEKDPEGWLGALKDGALAVAMAAAQVHATLALAAATALAGYIPESGMPEADKRAWYTTASEGPGEKQRVREARAAEAAEAAGFARDGAP